MRWPDYSYARSACIGFSLFVIGLCILNADAMAQRAKPTWDALAKMVHNYDGCMCEDCAPRFAGVAGNRVGFVCGTGRRQSYNPIRVLFGTSFATAGSILMLGFTRSRKPIVGRCAHCDYDLAGLPAGRCPECGSLHEPS